MTDHRYDTDTLLARLFDGSISEDEHAALARRADADLELKEEVRAIERLAEVIPSANGSGHRVTDLETMAAWKRVSARLGLSDSTLSSRRTRQAAADRPAATDRPAAPPLRLVPRTWVAAASVVLLAAFAWFLFQPDPSATWRTVQTERGQTASVTLIDGSTVNLNAETTIEYLISEDVEERQVRLSGEARFDVASSGRPFVVSTPHAAVRVLGTTFTVRARDEATRVAVQEGLVAVDADSIRVELKQNEAVQVSLSQAPIRLGADYATAADDWVQGTLSFSSAPLAEVTSDIERRFNATVGLTGAWSGEETLTGSFPGQDARTALETICRTFECEVIETAGERAFMLHRNP